MDTNGQGVRVFRRLGRTSTMGGRFGPPNASCFGQRLTLVLPCADRTAVHLPSATPTRLAVTAVAFNTRPSITLGAVLSLAMSG